MNIILSFGKKQTEENLENKCPSTGGYHISITEAPDDFGGRGVA